MSNNFQYLVTYRKGDSYSYSLYAFEILKSVADTISKLMSRVISEIIITPIRLLILHYLPRSRYKKGWVLKYLNKLWTFYSCVY